MIALLGIIVIFFLAWIFWFVDGTDPAAQSYITTSNHAIGSNSELYPLPYIVDMFNRELRKRIRKGEISYYSQRVPPSHGYESDDEVSLLTPHGDNYNRLPRKVQSQFARQPSQPDCALKQRHTEPIGRYSRDRINQLQAKEWLLRKKQDFVAKTQQIPFGDAQSDWMETASFESLQPQIGIFGGRRTASNSDSPAPDIDSDATSATKLPFFEPKVGAYIARRAKGKMSKGKSSIDSSTQATRADSWISEGDGPGRPADSLALLSMAKSPSPKPATAKEAHKKEPFEPKSDRANSRPRSESAIPTYVKSTAKRRPCSARLSHIKFEQQLPSIQEHDRKRGHSADSALSRSSAPNSHSDSGCDLCEKPKSERAPTTKTGHSTSGKTSFTPSGKISHTSGKTEQSVTANTALSTAKSNPSTPTVSDVIRLTADQRIALDLIGKLESYAGQSLNSTSARDEMAILKQERELLRKFSIFGSLLERSEKEQAPTVLPSSSSLLALDRRSRIACSMGVVLDSMHLKSLGNSFNYDSETSEETLEKRNRSRTAEILAIDSK